MQFNAGAGAIRRWIGFTRNIHHPLRSGGPRGSIGQGEPRRCDTLRQRPSTLSHTLSFSRSLARARSLFLSHERNAHKRSFSLSLSLSLPSRQSNSHTRRAREKGHSGGQRAPKRPLGMVRESEAMLPDRRANPSASIKPRTAEGQADRIRTRHAGHGPSRFRDSWSADTRMDGRLLHGKRCALDTRYTAC